MREFSEWIITEEIELEKLAAELIKFTKGNKILAFYGEMGSGKTTFIRQICINLGVVENVSSPTFSLINEYHDLKGQPVFHFDFYRIKNVKEAVDIGCEEYFQSGSICLIEWPEKILNLLPHPLVKVEIILVGTKHRFIFSYE